MTIIFDRLNDDLIVRDLNGSMFKEVLLNFIDDFRNDYRIRFIKCIAVDKSFYIEVEYVNQGNIFFASTTGYINEDLDVYYFLLDIVSKTGINTKNTIFRICRDKEVYVYAANNLSLVKCLNSLDADSEGFYYFFNEKNYQHLFD